MNQDQEQEYGQLLEALTLERILVEAKTTPFQHFGGPMKLWNFWGHRWPIPAHCNPRGYFDVEYRNTEGQLHRIYGPAYHSRFYNIHAWYKNGVLHRTGGPAYTHNYNMIWLCEGKLHRLDGPAVLDQAGPKQFWIHGQKYTQKQYKWEITRMKRKGKL